MRMHVQCTMYKYMCAHSIERLILHSSNAIRFVCKMQMKRINENFSTTFVICESTAAAAGAATLGQHRTTYIHTYINIDLITLWQLKTE